MKYFRQAPCFLNYFVMTMNINTHLIFIKYILTKSLQVLK